MTGHEQPRAGAGAGSGDSSVGQRLRDARTFLNLSVEFAAGELSISPSDLEDVEADRRPPTATELAGFSRLYRLTEEFLATGTDASLREGELKTLGRATGSMTVRDREAVERFAVFLSRYRRPGGETSR
ncbi:MAG: helix-turn-helix transcriptional regulator [Actinomycetales bacterium]